MELDRVLISQEILKRLGVKFNPNKTKQNITCWAHSPDRHPSLSVNLEKGIYNCFVCGDHGTLRHKYYETFHKDIYKDMGFSSTENLLRIGDEYKADFSKTPETDFQFEIKSKLYPISITDAGKHWLKQRGLTEKNLKLVNASYCQYGIFKQKSDPANKKEWIHCLNRVIIPIYENHNILSYELRDIMGITHYENQLKKKNLLIDDYPYKKLLYPKNSSVNTLFDIDKLKTNEPLYIVEGIMDLVSLRTYNIFKNSTCLFHNLPTERQYFLLEKFPKIIYIVNNDVPGLMGCKKLMERNKRTSYLCVPEKANDVNEILQKKDERFSTIEDLVEKWNWLSKINSSIENLEARIQKYVHGT
jgi:DNA primase